MTDLSTVLPDFNTQPYLRLIPSLERNHVTVADLLTLDVVEAAKRAQLPIHDLKKLSTAILETLQRDLGILKTDDEEGTGNEAGKLRVSGTELIKSWSTISTLDDELDGALGGGIPTGSITEITGESGAGKTQFLLTLLLSAQLPAPDGLAAQVLYMSTESALPTQRIAQLLRTHPRLIHLPAPSKPSLDKVISITVPDLESQDHILHYQVPVAVRRHGIRLIIIDSIAANYRAEFEGANGQATGAGSGGASMAERSARLVKLGQFLRSLARQYHLAIVVSNQVADRFVGNSQVAHQQAQSRMQSSPLERRSGPGIPPSSINLPDDDVPAPTPTPRSHGGTIDLMSLDHQQRFFTGWGDDPHPTTSAMKSMKTPSLGLIWSSQIACRIALIKRPVYGQAWVEGGVRGEGHDDGEGGELVLKRWRRWMKVVFASHAAASGRGTYGAVEFEIKGEGLQSLSKELPGVKDAIAGDDD